MLVVCLRVSIVQRYTPFLIVSLNYSNSTVSEVCIAVIYTGLLTLVTYLFTALCNLFLSLPSKLVLVGDFMIF